MSEIRRLSRSVKLGVIASALLSGFYLITEKTSWLQKQPLICGGRIDEEFIKTTDPIADIESKGGSVSFCVREVLRPYSESMADVWAGVTIYPNDKSQQKLLYVESQYFVAKDFGEDKFSDEPGDWVSKNVRTYSPSGILIEKSQKNISSAVDSFLDSESAIKLWEIMQVDVSQNYSSRQISWYRLISENATQITVIGLAAASAWGSILQINAATCEESGSGSCPDDYSSESARSRSRILAAFSSTEVRREFLSLTIIFAVLLSGWCVFRYTNWLRPSSFKCNSYQSQVAPGKLKVCFNEILSLPSESNQSIVVGVTADDGNTFLASDMEFYVADGNNTMGFSDEEGDWAFLGYRQFNSNTGLLVKRSDVTTSVWYDTVIPADIQMKLWNDVKNDLAKNYSVNRLSITRKITGVLGSFAALGGAVLIAVVTFVRAVELSLYKEIHSEDSNLLSSTEF